jgi:hypothetical protein
MYVLIIARIDCRSFVVISMQIVPLSEVILIFSVEVRNLVSGCNALLIVCATLEEISEERLSRAMLILVFTLCSFKVYIICSSSNFVIAFWTRPNS